MPSTFSNNLRLELMGTGDQPGDWGTTTNRNLGTLIESAISGAVAVTTTSANQALTVVDGATDQARSMILKLDTTTGATYNVYAPPNPKVYVVRNESATYAAQLFNSTVSGNTTAAGTGITIPASTSLVVFSDGTDMLGISVTTNANLSGVVTSVGNTTSFASSTGSGAVVLDTSPTLNSPTLVTPDLGTPTALVGTNITGTATSFNINGTVGATTPAAGSFTGVDFDTYTETVYAVSGATPALSPDNGTIQTWTLSANSTPTAGTWASGQSLTLMVDDGSAYTITWTSLGVVWKTDAGIAPILNTTGETAIQLWKVSSTIYGARVGDA